jgi:hypothetical protein
MLSVNLKAESHNRIEPLEQINKHLNQLIIMTKIVILIRMILKLILMKLIPGVEEMSLMQVRFN